MIFCVFTWTFFLLLNWLFSLWCLWLFEILNLLFEVLKVILWFSSSRSITSGTSWCNRIRLCRIKWVALLLFILGSLHTCQNRLPVSLAHVFVFLLLSFLLCQLLFKLVNSLFKESNRGFLTLDFLL